MNLAGKLVVAEKDLLWHYCMPNTFLAMITNRTLRFSSLSHTNDSMELKWGLNLFQEILNDQMYESSFMDFIECRIIPWLNSNAFLGICFSRRKDLLSQWRGYAENGSGYAVGFSKNDLTSRFKSFPSLGVCYSRSQQRKRLEDILSSLERRYEDEHERGVSELISQLGFCIATFKNSAFKEEKEFRILMELKRFSDFISGPRLVPKEGQYNFDRPKKVQFRMSGGVPTPFYDHSFLVKKQQMPIREVMIGPKNSSTEDDVATFLSTNDLWGIEVSKSKASYR